MQGGVYIAGFADTPVFDSQPDISYLSTGEPVGASFISKYSVDGIRVILRSPNTFTHKRCRAWLTSVHAAAAVDAVLPVQYVQAGGQVLLGPNLLGLELQSAVHESVGSRCSDTQRCESLLLADRRASLPRGLGVHAGRQTLCCRKRVRVSLPRTHCHADSDMVAMQCVHRHRGPKHCRGGLHAPTRRVPVHCQPSCQLHSRYERGVTSCAQWHN